MTPEERARNVLDANPFPYDLSCEMTEEAEEALMDLIKFQIREAQREAVERVAFYILSNFKGSDRLDWILPQLTPEKVLGEG